MRVADLMTTEVASCKADEPLRAAAKLMWDCDCGAVPVLDDEGRVIAMITDRDICMAALMRDRAPSAIPVSEAMSHDLQCCGPDDNVSAAEQMMRAHQVRRVPIVDRERRPLGMLSLADIARASDHHPGRGARPVPAEEVAETLAEICTMPARNTNPPKPAAF